MAPKISIPVLKTAHRVAGSILMANGFDWETTSLREPRLGLWRKRYRAAGSGGAKPRNLILLPGLGDTALSWLPVLRGLGPVLKKHYDEVALLDFPGFGGFLGGEKNFPSMERLLQSLDEVMSVLVPHTVIGHSFGGWLTTDYAARARESRPELIILASPAGVHESDQARQVWDHKIESGVRLGFGYFRQHLFKKEPRWFSLVASENAPFISRDDTVGLLSSIAPEHMIQERLAQVRSQVFFIWGADDSLTMASALPAWIAGLKNARGGAKAAVIPGVGHCPQLEATAAVRKILAGILENQRIPAGKGWKTAG